LPFSFETVKYFLPISVLDNLAFKVSTPPELSAAACSNSFFEILKSPLPFSGLANLL
jgi:hypothetical protein